MRYRMIVVAVAVALSALLLVETGQGAKEKKERPKGQRANMVGTVNATTDDAGAVTAVTLTLKDETVVNIVLDENAQKLAAERNGKEVRVTALVSEIKVLTYRDATGEKTDKPKKVKKTPKTDDAGGDGDEAPKADVTEGAKDEG